MRKRRPHDVEPLLDVKALEQYADWMQALCAFIPDAGYEIKSFATDEERRGVCAYAVFSGTHTGEGAVPTDGREYVDGLCLRHGI